VRQVFAHDAVVAMPSDGDVGAPGAAITVALCGHWEHEPPCPLAPHHTAAERDGDGDAVRLRVLFAAQPEDEAEVRRRIDDALARAQLPTPDGAVAHWELVTTGPGAVRPGEAEHARRLAAS
jgi:hypothetical protein